MARVKGGSKKLVEISKPTQVEVPTEESASGFPIVGIGASAGGLEAFTQLLNALAVDTGMGFVLVQHLDPDHESALVQILQRSTLMPVKEITQGQQVEPNQVYVIPRDRRSTSRSASSSVG